MQNWLLWVSKNDDFTKTTGNSDWSENRGKRLASAKLLLLLCMYIVGDVWVYEISPIATIRADSKGKATETNHLPLFSYNKDKGYALLSHYTKIIIFYTFEIIWGFFSKDRSVLILMESFQTKSYKTYWDGPEKQNQTLLPIPSDLHHWPSSDV